MVVGEVGNYGKNGKVVRSGMATREAGRGGGRQILHKRRSWGEAKERRRRRSTALVEDQEHGSTLRNDEAANRFVCKDGRFFGGCRCCAATTMAGNDDD
jgi:hypothetical protein